MHRKFNHTLGFGVRELFRYLIFLMCLLAIQFSPAQDLADRGHVSVHRDGVMRWENGEEVHGFGVNYSVPFAHAFRSAKRMGIDIKEVIDHEVYHFKRLGFDLYRLHVWDTEISDAEGNLLENENLELFDYLLSKLKEAEINYVITPIAFWGNGWPEPDENTAGFSHKYGKSECLTDPSCIKAQQNYLYQFLNHVNPFTGLAYKDDPSVIAFEVSNEPHHRGEGKAVTTFVRKMSRAMRRTGTRKPIFYNMSHAVHFAQDYFNGKVDGGTFQWYPTGLGYQRELSGNLLPNVDLYNIPFESVFKKNRAAKLVYEFDAADVGRSYIYPAMARSFRTAGIQIATHFAYDPTYLAPFNTEYNTHYMNLAYTPKKALSLKICAEVFREIPMYSEFGSYPENKIFGHTRVDYNNDLAVFNSETKFIHTNHTTDKPISESTLVEIAGSGKSPIVSYSGNGVYFLDKVDDHLWRLEVMPDAVWVDNPFGRNSPDKTVGVIKWSEHNMEIRLENLGKDFNVIPINDGNDHKPLVSEGAFKIRPGTYMLEGNQVKKNWSVSDIFNGYKLNEFNAPKSNVDRIWFRHQPSDNLVENTPTEISLQIVASEKPEAVLLMGWGGSGGIELEMEEYEPYQYHVVIPADKMTLGFLHYFIQLKWSDSNTTTYPSAWKGKPSDWDFSAKPYRVAVVPKSSPVLLFDAANDTELLVRRWRPGFKLVPTDEIGLAEYQMNLDKLFVPDNENLNADPIYDYSFKHFVSDQLNNNKGKLENMSELVFYGRSLNDKPCKLQIALVLDDGSSYGGMVGLMPEVKEYSLDLSELKPVKMVTLPRPYPTFLPYYFSHENQGEFDLDRVESIQFSIGPGMSEQEQLESHGIGLIRVWLK